MSGTAAYLRRSMELLHWIELHQPEATIVFQSVDWGIWRELAPRWTLDGNQIRFSMRSAARSVQLSVSSVRPAPWGASLHLRSRAGPAPEVRIVWEGKESK